MLEHYKTKTLWRWLRSRGYQNELQGVEAIKVTQDKEILKALCEVFGIEADLQMIQEVLENRRNLQEQENEALRARLLKAIQARVQQLQDKTPSKNPTPAHVSNLAECLKSYYALKGKLFNTSNLESSKEIFKQLLKDYADLLKMERLEILRYCYNKRHENYHFLILFFYMCHYLLKKYEFFVAPEFKRDNLETAKTMKHIMEYYINRKNEKSGNDIIKPNVIAYVCYDFSAYTEYKKLGDDLIKLFSIQNLTKHVIINAKGHFSRIQEECKKRKYKKETMDIFNIGTRGIFYQSGIGIGSLIVPSSSITSEIVAIELPTL
ncbi:hypothetical protein [Helicobacter salomonis]|uniref:hypothetical protein n=1 Tax=Helicobacter salomonis TaxID=56878 RepID=UPI001315939E|nr:hypothetical protein [Helicobacter salomonis]